MEQKNIVFVLCVILTALPSAVFAAFGDRIRPITPNPMFFRNYSVSPTSTASSRLMDDSAASVTQSSLANGSPEPGDDEVAGTPIDALIHEHELTEDEIAEISDNGNEFNDGEKESLQRHSTELPVSGNAVTEDELKAEKSVRILDKSIYPLEPPQLLTNESISSSDTYSRFQYAIPPVVNPYHKEKVVFLSPIRPKEGHHHDYSGTAGTGRKVYKLVDMPTYRDGGPRIRYIKKKIIPGPHHRYPAHLHVAKYPPGKFPTHSHEYHHHPIHDAKYYGYIPGIPGKPWKDYPLYSHVPLTGFSCKLTKYPGFYADVDAGCQVWHYCQLDGRHDKFLCPNGTIFNQQTRVCDWWFNVDCPSSIWKYNVNKDMYSQPKKVKKVLHIHPGKQPHVHRIPAHGKGVYTLTGVGGTRYKLRPLSLQEKIHKHHFKHHPHGGKTYVPRLHPLMGRNAPMHPTSLHPHPHAMSPHFKAHPVHPIHGTNRQHVVKVLRKMPHHMHHLDHHIYSKVHHSVHHIPLTDSAGRVPHHGHLILHHKVKK